MRITHARTAAMAGLVAVTLGASTAAHAAETPTGGAPTTTTTGAAHPTTAPETSGAPGAATPAPVSETATVQLTRSQTKSVQRRAHVKADGAMGAGTRAALRRYQSSKRLKRTGQPNIETLRAMKLKLAERLAAGQQSGSDAPTAPGGPVPAGSATTAIAAAREQIGVPYQTAGTTPSGFDCSGLMVFAFEKAGITIPRTSFDEYASGAAVEQPAVQPGDLVFFDTDGPGASHVGIATSPTTVISATSHGVMEHDIDDEYWGAHYLGARRVAG